MNRNKDEEYSSVEPFYAFSKITWSMGWNTYPLDNTLELQLVTSFAWVYTQTRRPVSFNLQQSLFLFSKTTEIGFSLLFVGSLEVSD